MPWTFAHPAAVLPIHTLSGRRLPLPALIAGSLAPDAGYYIGQFALATHAHSLPGLLLLCVPVALLILLLLRRVAGDCLLLLPAASRPVLEAALVLPGAADALLSPRVLLACWLGAASHLLWDMATHQYGGLVLQWPWLAGSVALWPGFALPAFKLLQYGSSVFGIGVLWLAYRSKRCQYAAGVPDECGLAGRQSRRFFLLLLGGAGLFAMVLAYWSLHAVPADRMLRFWLVRSIVISTVLVLAGWIVCALVWRQPFFTGLPASAAERRRFPGSTRPARVRRVHR